MQLLAGSHFTLLLSKKECVKEYELEANFWRNMLEYFHIKGHFVLQVCGIDLPETTRKLIAYVITGDSDQEEHSGLDPVEFPGPQYLDTHDWECSQMWRMLSL